MKKSIIALILLLMNAQLFALPNINQVVNGEVNIVQASEKSLQVNQNSDKAIVNWNSFNLDANETVHFQQPVNGICLNRIDATNGMSQIAGNLSSTAKVIFINNAGVLFADTAQVNVGGIIASAIDISDDNFLNYRPLNFDQQSSTPGAIINRGIINVKEYGLAALLGNSVSNEGVISATHAQVVLEVGNKFTLDFYGDGVINFEMVSMPGSTSIAGVDENGNQLPNALNMSGKIVSDYGDVLLMASAVPGIFDNLINMSGEIQARNAVAMDSEIILVGDKHGIVNVTGKLDATGAIENTNRGGTIIVAGDDVVIDDKASLNVSADAGYGWIALGDLSGELDWLDTPYSRTLYVGPDVTLIADAYTTGRAGGIYMRSNLKTNFLGTANARGTTDKYSGGYVEIASKGDVRFYEAQAKIDVSASNGGRVVITKQY